MNFMKRHTDLDVVPIVVRGVPNGQRAERKWPISYESLDFATVLADAVIILSVGILTSTAYNVQAFGTTGDLGQHAGASAVVAALFIVLMKGQGMYRPAELLLLGKQLRAVCLVWATVFLLLAGILFTLKAGDQLSRGSILLFAGAGLGAIAVHRIFWRRLLTRGISQRRLSGRKIVLITDHPRFAGRNLPHLLARLGFQLDHHFRLPPPELGAQDRRDTINRAIACIRGSEVEEIVVGTDLSNWSDLRELVAQLRVLPLPVNLIPVGAISEIMKQPSQAFGNTVCVEIQRGPLTQFECVIKRTVDIVLAAAALVAFLPLLVTVAIAIKLDSPGPVFFRQRRCGFNGRCFQIFKFRTMSVQEDGATVTQAQRCDTRVTRLGHLLRVTSIDELPQLLNVLEGTMSLVGPRPHAIAHDTAFDKVVKNYAFRHRVKPGLTGWAQVNGFRGPTPTPRDIELRVQHDLWYIDNWSFRLDFTIMLQTFAEVLRRRNAY
jgi:putative colanic acid biosynthesis UDP-glucose lipid carrier transferase